MRKSVDWQQKKTLLNFAKTSSFRPIIRKQILFLHRGKTYKTFSISQMTKGNLFTLAWRENGTMKWNIYIYQNQLHEYSNRHKNSR